MKKIIILPLALCAFLICGCRAAHDPAFWGAMNQGTQQYNQQQMLQQQQRNLQLQQMQEQQLLQQQQQQMQRQNAGSAAYNPYSGKYQYVPPGWHKIWDSTTSTWIIQPN
jgi:transcription initiation factor TFIID subunit TAF12